MTPTDVQHQVLFFNALAACGLLFVYLAARFVFQDEYQSRRPFFLNVSIAWFLNLVYVVFTYYVTDSDPQGSNTTSELIIILLNLSSNLFVLFGCLSQTRAYKPDLVFFRHIPWIVALSACAAIAHWQFPYVWLAKTAMVLSVLSSAISWALLGFTFAKVFKLKERFHAPRIRHLLIDSTYTYALLQFCQLIPNSLVDLGIAVVQLHTIFFFAGGALKLTHLSGLILYAESFIDEYKTAGISALRHVELRRLMEQLVHELNTPAAALRVQLETLEISSKSPSEWRSQLPLMTQSARLLHAILASFQMLLRIQPGDHAALVPVVCNVNSFAEAAIVRLKIAYHIRRKWIRNYSAQPTVKIAEVELLQIFQNILKNAVEATEQVNKPQIAVTTRVLREDGDNRSEKVAVEVMVADNGTGVSASDLSCIFKDGFSTKEGFGRGHGLAVAKRLVEKYGGAIKCESKLEGAPGTCFTVRLPYVRQD